MTVLELINLQNECAKICGVSSQPIPNISDIEINKIRKEIRNNKLNLEQSRDLFNKISEKKSIINEGESKPFLEGMTNGRVGVPIWVLEKLNMPNIPKVNDIIYINTYIRRNFEVLKDKAEKMLKQINDYVQTDKFKAKYDNYIISLIAGSKQGKLIKCEQIEEKEILKKQKFPETIKYAISVMELFIESSCTKTMFTEAVGINNAEFDKLGDIVREYNPELGEELNKVLDLNSIKYFEVMNDCVNRVSQNIRYGLRQTNGRVIPYTIFDYSINEYPNINTLVDFATKVGSEKTRILKNFVMGSKCARLHINKEKVLQEKITYNGYEVQESDKIAVLEFLKINKLDCNNGNYKGALISYINNKQFPKVKYGAEYKENQAALFSRLREQFEKLSTTGTCEAQNETVAQF